MTTIAYHPSFSRKATGLPRKPARTPRRRPVWWLRGTHRPALA